MNFDEIRNRIQRLEKGAWKPGLHQPDNGVSYRLRKKVLEPLPDDDQDIPYELFRAGKISKALRLYNRDIQSNPDNGFYYRARAEFFLALGDLAKARRDHEKAISLYPPEPQTKNKRWHSDADMKSIGVTYWLEGDKQKAAETWLTLSEALARGRVSYSDMAGGAGSGLLLWFAGVRLSRPDLIDLTRLLFEKLTKGNRWGGLNSWPGPVGKLFLGKINETQLMKAVNRTPQLRERELCQAYCALAVSALAKGNRKDYRKQLRCAAALPSPAEMEEEYYLARFEISKSSR